MSFDLIDKNLNNFKKYQLTLLRTARKDYLILSLVTMILGVSALYIVITQVHNKPISESIMLGMFCIFPGPIILAVAISFLCYLKNRDKKVSIEAGSLIYEGKKFAHDSIWLIEVLGPYVINVQMRGMKGFRFVSEELDRNKKIIEEIRKIKPGIQIKHHLMGYPAKLYLED